MAVWLAVPSKRPPAEAERALSLWRRQGYLIAVWRDRMTEELPDGSKRIVSEDPPVMCDMELRGHYRGYADAVNKLVHFILRTDEEVSFIVTAGDDTEPDLNHSASEIARQCIEHFKGTFGVMQPTGDGHGIETIAGSPWMGKEWCKRANMGNGPLWHQYTHNFVDNELQEVATKLGVFWQRPDLTHKHNNWMFTGAPKPAFLEEAYSKEHWQKYRKLFVDRRNAGFPGHEPLPPSKVAKLNAGAQLGR